MRERLNEGNVLAATNVCFYTTILSLAGSEVGLAGRVSVPKSSVESQPFYLFLRLQRLSEWIMAGHRQVTAIISGSGDPIRNVPWQLNYQRGWSGGSGGSCDTTPHTPESLLIDSPDTSLEFCNKFTVARFVIKLDTFLGWSMKCQIIHQCFHWKVGQF